MVKPRRITLLLRRPELGALLGALVIFVMFSFFDSTGKFAGLEGMARWSDSAATLGIMAVVISLLLISGEFDLSAGVMIGSSGLLLGLLTTEWGWNIWPAIIAVFVFAGAIGAMNGFIVLRTGLPSFIVTLATFFVLRGLNLGYTKFVTGSVRVDRIDEAAGFDGARALFASEWFPPYYFRIGLVWWIVIALVATWVLTRTRFGNWIYAIGGNAVSARNLGVPVFRTKILLFMTTAMGGALVGIMTALRLRSTQAGQGVGEEFNFIIAAVVGGTLLTGGFGSAIGAALGALVIGMAFVGISFAGWNTDWNFLFLGLILFLAVMVNTMTRKRAEGARS